jgi:hypothetical protein
VHFLVAGSAGRALRGCRVRPRDLDLEVDPAGAGVAGRALGVRLVRARGRGRDGLRGRARIAGAEVDVTAGLEVRGPAGTLRGDWAAQRAASTAVRVGGRVLALAPPEEHLTRALVLGEWAVIEKAARGCDGVPLDAGYISSRLASLGAPPGGDPAREESAAR